MMGRRNLQNHVLNNEDMDKELHRVDFHLALLISVKITVLAENKK